MEPLTGQDAKDVRIFACDKYELYGDVEASLGGGFSTEKVTDVKGDWHFAKREETGAWVNTGMFIQVWKAIADWNAPAGMDCVGEVAVDAVFVPDRLTPHRIGQSTSMALSLSSFTVADGPEHGPRT